MNRKADRGNLKKTQQRVFLSKKHKTNRLPCHRHSPLYSHCQTPEVVSALKSVTADDGDRRACKQVDVDDEKQKVKLINVLFIKVTGIILCRELDEMTHGCVYSENPPWSS